MSCVTLLLRENWPDSERGESFSPYERELDEAFKWALNPVYRLLRPYEALQTEMDLASGHVYILVVIGRLRPDTLLHRRC